MFDAVDGLDAEHAELESRLGDPEAHADPRLAKQLNQRYAELSRVLAAKRDYDAMVDDIEAARELAAEDPTFAAEADRLWPTGSRASRSGCVACSCHATPPTTRTPSSR